MVFVNWKIAFNSSKLFYLFIEMWKLGALKMQNSGHEICIVHSLGYDLYKVRAWNLKSVRHRICKVMV